MTAELLVNVTPSETRVAYIDGGILQEIHIEREGKSAYAPARSTSAPDCRNQPSLRTWRLCSALA